jgi:hypothetical protein
MLVCILMPIRKQPKQPKQPTHTLLDLQTRWDYIAQKDTSGDAKLVF